MKIEGRTMTGETIQSMRNVLNIQAQDGNWDYDDYMLGMYNGMELMMAIAEDREPQYRSLQDDKEAFLEQSFGNKFGG